MWLNLPTTLQLATTNKQQPSLSYKVGSATRMKQCHNVVSYSMSLFNSLIYKSFLIVSHVVFLSFSLPQVIWLPSIWLTLRTTESTSLVSTCTNHIRQVSTIFSTIGASLTLYLMLSYLIVSHLVLLHNQRNILISATQQSKSCI